jgi:alanine-synthesizing transaminase
MPAPTPPREETPDSSSGALPPQVAAPSDGKRRSTKDQGQTDQGPADIEPRDTTQESVPWGIPVASRVRRLPAYLFARINRLMYEKRRAGADVIDLGMGNPSDPPQQIVIDKLSEAARDPDSHGYSPASGIMSLRREVAAKYFKKYGVRLDPEGEVIVCLGSKEGFSHMCLALLGPGDTAIVPAPSYPAHLYGVALAAGNVISLEVADSSKFLANIAYTCQVMHPKPKVVIVNFPHNPTAATVEADFYVELVKLAKKYSFLVLSDLAYGDVAFEGYVPPSFLAAPDAIKVGVEFTTMSKGYNMAGWRVGFAAGNSEMLRALATVKAYYDYGMFRPIQIASIIALRHTDAAVEEQSAIYERRRDVLCDGLARLGWAAPRPRASMFVWAKIPEPWLSRMTSLDFAMKLLEQADVAVSPGGGFGPAGEGFLRLALVENENRLRQAVRQIGRCLK